MAFLFCYHQTKEESQKTLGHWDQLQEADYNIARGFHQIGTLLKLSRLLLSCLTLPSGLFHLAIPYYEKALQISDEHLSKIPGSWDIKYEAAYNLQQIYATSGNFILAREVTAKYLVL